MNSRLQSSMGLREAIEHYRHRLEALKRGKGIPKRDRDRMAELNMQGHYKMIGLYLDRAEEELPQIKTGRDMDFVKVLIQAAEMRLFIAFYNPYLMRDEERLMTAAQNRRPRFSAKFVVSQIKWYLKPESKDNLLQLWRDGINSFGEHEIECDYSDGKYCAYVNNDESIFYAPNRTWEWTKRTLAENW